MLDYDSSDERGPEGGQRPWTTTGAGLKVSILRYPGYEDLGGGMEIGAQVGILGGGLSAVRGDRGVGEGFESASRSEGRR